MAKAKKNEETVEVAVETKKTKSKKTVESVVDTPVAVVDSVIDEKEQANKSVKKKQSTKEIVENNANAIEVEVPTPVVDSKSNKKSSKKKETKSVEAEILDIEEEVIAETKSKTKGKKATVKPIVIDEDIVDEDDDEEISIDEDEDEVDFIAERPREDEEESEFHEDEIVDLVETDIVAIPPIEEIHSDLADAKKRKRRSKKNSDSEFEPFNEPIKIEGKAFKLNKGDQPIQVPSKKEHLDDIPAELIPDIKVEPTASKPLPKAHKKGKKDEPVKKDHKYLAQAAEIKANLKNQENRTDMPKPEQKKVEIVPKAPLPNVRYSDEDLQMFFEVISMSKNESIEELRMLRERLDDLTSSDHADELMIYSMHMAEQGSEAIEKEKTYAQVQRISEYLKKLDDALERIKNKTYGICRICGCLIAKERLLAVPITTLSASYKIQEKCPEDNIDRIEPLRNRVQNKENQ